MTEAKLWKDAIKNTIYEIMDGIERADEIFKDPDYARAFKMGAKRTVDIIRLRLLERDPFEGEV